MGKKIRWEKISKDKWATYEGQWSSAGVVHERLVIDVTTRGGSIWDQLVNLTSETET